MRLYRKVVYQLVPKGTQPGLEELSGYWDILETITDEKEIEKFILDANEEDTYWRIGAYTSPRLANYTFSYEFYKDLSEILKGE